MTGSDGFRRSALFIMCAGALARSTFTMGSGRVPAGSEAVHFSQGWSRRDLQRHQTPTQSECILQDLNDSNKRIRSETIEISPMWAVADKECDFGTDRFLK